MVGVVACLVVSFFVLRAVRARSPRLSVAAGGPVAVPAGDLSAGRATRMLLLPRPVGRAIKFGLSVLGVVGCAWTAAAAWFGPDDAFNPTAGMFFVILWVGLVGTGPLLIGPLWASLNPLRLLIRARRRPPRPVPAWVGPWPAASLFAAFCWLELVAPSGQSIVVLRWFAVAYALIVGLGTLRFGAAWFDHADPFDVLARAVGRASVVRRLPDGRIALGPPLVGLWRSSWSDTERTLVAMALATTLFDSLTTTRLWSESSVVATAGTVGVTAIFFIMMANAVVALRQVRGLDEHTSGTLVPVMVGYLVAHYWALTVVFGPATLIRLGDPLGTGADPFGVSRLGVSDLLAQPEIVAPVQVNAILLGHVAGTIALDAASRRVGRHGLRDQLPITVAMLVFAVVGMGMLMAW
jgi:hypothetical protein